eukprot:85835_1
MQNASSIHGEWGKCRIVPPDPVPFKIPVIDSHEYPVPPDTPKKHAHPYIRLTETGLDLDLSFINTDSPSKPNCKWNMFKLNTRRFCVPKQFKSNALEKEFQRCYQDHSIPLIYIYIISYFIINIAIYLSQRRRFISNPHTLFIVYITRTFLCIFLLVFICLFYCKVWRFKQPQAMLCFNIILCISELFICAIADVPEHTHSQLMLLMLFIHMFSGLHTISSCILSWGITLAFTAMSYIKERPVDWSFVYTSVPYLFVAAACLSVLSVHIEHRARHGFLKLVELRIQKRISKQSLSMLLPPDVAQWLLVGRRMAVQFKYNLNDPNPRYHGVSVMFCEICNFEQLVSRLSPHHLISTLNKVFTKWDDHIQLHKLFKLKTIGSSYIAAGGLPYPAVDPNDPFHCIRMVFCANDLMYYCHEVMKVIAADENEIHVTQWTEDEFEHEQEEFKPQPAPVEPELLAMRIGLNIGPVVGGVIGKELPRYDLFGDTINVASRMKSTCKPCEIQMTQAFYDALPEAFHVSIKKKKPFKVKGKGEMTTYLLQHMDRNEPLDVRMIKRTDGSKHFRQMPMIPSETSIEPDDIMDAECGGFYFGTTRVRNISATHQPMPTDIGPTLLDVLAGQIDMNLDVEISDSNACAAYTLLDFTECDSLLNHNDNKIPYSE